MWVREELKARGKSCFLKNYWPAVAVSVILLIISGDLFNVNVDLGDLTGNVEHIGEGFRNGMGISASGIFSMFSIRSLFSMMMAGVAGLIGILGIVFTVFVKNVVEVGANRFYMENRERRADVISILYGFKSGGYSNVVLGMFLRDLYVFLWSLLLVIPGIIKSYEYRMV